MQHVFIVGSKGIPARYGGYETFVDKLVEHQSSSQIKYHVACAVDAIDGASEFEYNGAHCFKIEWRPLGSARAITYDIDGIRWSINYIKQHSIERPIIYVLACRIGPFIGTLAKQIHQLGGLLYVNPDGHEWLRAKWSLPIRKYWKLSERGMVKHSDLLICDSKNIERYIRSEYSVFSPKTKYIAYGADIHKSRLRDDDPCFVSWLAEKGLAPNGYYLVVGRFVPENNYETMIREFMSSETSRSFALITDTEESFLERLQGKTGFLSDPRIKFVGTVYDQELLKKIRECAFAYLHGHEVGGTNPSLLEALASTRLNLLLNIGFNREVAEDSALYWTKDNGSLRKTIGIAERLDEISIRRFDEKSTLVISERYSWRFIVAEYENLFLKKK
ncbi:MAG: glycosyltransferase family 1 protein [Eggerthellaceae bacterium]|nr:glycosyltransferase family 1 protein [Eggerthellaceae bacterium]